MNPQVAYETVGQTLRVLVPEILIVAVSIAMMTLSPFLNWPRRHWCAISAGTLLNDALGFYGRLVLLLTGLVLLALGHDAPSDATAGEFFGALLLVNTGAMLVMTANELVFLFVGLELVSIPTYLLLYLTRRTVTTQETAAKYFYLSIFSSGLLLYGLAFLYGVSGVSNLKSLATLTWLVPSIPHPQLGLIAVVFILAGLCFRVAAVPFHFYAPDVYQGSPTVIAALLSWIPKGVLAEQPEAAIGVLVDCACRLLDDWGHSRVLQPTRPQLGLLRVREYFLLPRCLCAYDPGRLRGDHRPADRRS